MTSPRNHAAPLLAAPLVAALAAAALALPAAPAAAQAKSHEQLSYPPLPEFEIPLPERVVLDNGLVVMLLEDHELPLVDAIALVRTGQRWEPAELAGVAELSGEVLRTGGTAEMGPDELDDWLESQAASIESSISTEYGLARMSSLAEDFPAVLGVFADVLRRPAFAADRLEVARTRVETRISRQNDDPLGILFREITDLVYGETSPYARNPTYASVAAVDAEDLAAWHARWYHPERVILGLVGDFDRAEALELVRREFGDWPRGPGVEEPEAGWRETPAPGVYHAVKSGVTQSNIAMGHLGIRQDHPDFYAVEVMNNVLSGSFSSRLFSEVRTRQGLAYAVSGEVGADYDHPGMTLLWMTTKTDSTAAGIEALLAEARGMESRPVTEEEVAKSKESILNSFVFNFDAPSKILQQQLTYEYFGYPLDRMERYRAGIEAVTVDQVRRAAAEHLHPERFAILVVGPAEGLDRPLSSFGQVTAVDITIPEPAAPEAAAAAGGDPARGAELIARAVEAMGGAEALDAVEAVEIELTMEQQGPAGPGRIEARMVLGLPDRLRQEMTTPQGKMVLLVDGDAGWAVLPQGVVELPPSQLTELQRALARDVLVLLASRGEPGFAAAAVGEGEVAGTPVVRVAVERAGGPVTLGIDPESGRVLSLTYRGAGPSGALADREFRFSDFREVDGLTFSFTTEVFVDGEPQGSGTVQQVRVNPPVEATLFRPPAEGAAAGTER